MHHNNNHYCFTFYFKLFLKDFLKDCFFLDLFRPSYSLLSASVYCRRGGGYTKNFDVIAERSEVSLVINSKRSVPCNEFASITNGSIN